ncbi:hypothetical protein XELAEV_18032755mg [Xenopus laevis]|uniref:Cystatin domain-containing protein n=1 Tax=Xenopus laevis TaxID=8355 RepID=A0A974CJH0_XENLA|nr:hypothetical protein XELAEV_18032755mg [Xenopus laevis]
MSRVLSNGLRVSVTALTCAALVICAPLSLERPPQWDQDVAVEKLIHSLNNGHNGNFTFRLRGIERDSQSGAPNEGLRLKVTLQETLCLISEDLQNQNCPFNPDGEVKVCLLHMEQPAATSTECTNNVKDRNREVRVHKRELNSTTLETDFGETVQILSCLECIFDLFY